MLVTRRYDRESAVLYARTWALGRNPLFLNFTGIGGDCTNFISQCVLAGSCAMNYTPTFGWYYITAEDRTPSWTGVDYFYNFMTENQGVGPYATLTTERYVLPGDVVQLGQRGGDFYHTLLITGFRGRIPLVCAHSDDALDRRLDSYVYDQSRFLHIERIRVDLDAPQDRNCLPGLLSGEAL